MATGIDKLSQSEPSSCFYCKKNVIDPFSCPGCGKNYHPSCAKSSGSLPNGFIVKCCKPKSRATSSSDNTSPSTVRDVERIVSNAVGLLSASIDGLSKKMDECSQQININTARIVTVETDVQGLSTRMSTVEGTISRIESVVQSDGLLNHDDIFNRCMHEFEDRMTKKKNIMVFGLPENFGSQSSNGSLNSDKILPALNNLIFGSLKSDLMDNVVITRVGKVSIDQQSPLPRPVKISCISADHALRLFQAFMNAKKDGTRMNNLRNIWITFDKTSAEIRELKGVKSELLSRRQKGETNLILSYCRGRPMIVVKSSVTSTSHLQS